MKQSLRLSWSDLPLEIRIFLLPVNYEDAEFPINVNDGINSCKEKNSLFFPRSSSGQCYQEINGRDICAEPMRNVSKLPACL